MPTITPKLINDVINVLKSFVPMASPIPRIGPINGEINMAPIMTAVESLFNPIQATTMEQ